MGKRENYLPNIGVKHYVNTRLKPLTSQEEGVEKLQYPLYVQITFRGRTNRIRSVLYSWIAEEDFESFRSENSNDLFIEELNIKRKIKELNPPETAREKPVWEDLEDDKYSFELSKLITDELSKKVNTLMSETMSRKMIANERIWRRAKYHNLPATTLTEDESIKSLENYFPSDPYWNPESDIFRPDNYFYFGERTGDDVELFSPLNFLSFFFADYIPGFRELRELYGSDLWDIESYIAKIQQDEKRRFITLDEWNTGEFDNSFMASWNDEKALLSIKNGVSSLRASNRDIDALFNRYQPYTIAYASTNE